MNIVKFKRCAASVLEALLYLFLIGLIAVLVTGIWCILIFGP